MQLRIISESGETDYTIPIHESLEIGRSPESSLSLVDSAVSWRHAHLWVQEGVLWLRDLGSTNGTFVNEKRIHEAVAVADGDVIRLGASQQLCVEGAPEPQTQPPRQGFFLEDLGSGVRHALTPGSLRLDGATAAAMGIQHPGGALVLSPDGALCLQIQGAELPLVLGEPFDLLERQVRVVRGALAPSGTAHQEEEPWPYRLEIWLNGPRGVEALLTDRSTGTAHTISSENRALLLYVLASQVLQDQKTGVRAEAVGWCSDQDVIVGIWGRGGVSSDSALHVLVFRLRKELERAGFDQAFIEKDRRVLRIRLRDILLR